MTTNLYQSTLTMVSQGDTSTVSSPIFFSNDGPVGAPVETEFGAENSEVRYDTNAFPSLRLRKDVGRRTGSVEVIVYHTGLPRRPLFSPILFPSLSSRGTGRGQLRVSSHGYNVYV